MPAKHKTSRHTDKDYQHVAADGRRCTLLRMGRNCSLCFQHWSKQREKENSQLRGEAVTIPARAFAKRAGALKLRQPILQKTEKEFLTFTLGAHFKKALFGGKVERQMLGDEIRHPGHLFELQRRRSLSRDQRGAPLVERKELSFRGAGRRPRIVLEVFDVAFEERVVGMHVFNAKGNAADGQDVHAAVFVLFGDAGNLRCAPDARDPLGAGEDHSEFGLRVETPLDHPAITRLENMQRQRRQREENHLKRKERDTRRSHSTV